MEKVFCNDLQPGNKIRIITKRDEVQDHVIVKMIPMQLFKDGVMLPIEDIEILLDKKKNTYFSYSMYLKGESWVKEIKIRAKKK